MQQRLLALIISCYLVSYSSVQADGKILSPEIQQKLQTIYSGFDSKLKECSSVDKTKDREPVKIEVLNEPSIPKTYIVETEGGTLLHIWADGLRFRSILNSDVWKSVMYDKN